MNPPTIQMVPPVVTNIVVPKVGTLIPNRIFVGGITASTTEDDLRLFFGKFGQVKDVKIICDRSGLSKGNYGFVTFEHRDTAERIIRNEGESLVFNDRKLNIGHAVRKQNLLHRQDGSGQLVFSNTSLPCSVPSGIPYIPVNNQAVPIATSNLQSMHSPTLIIPQQSNGLSGFDQSHPKIPHYSPTPILQVPFNTAAMQGDQRQQILQGTSVIPAGAILFTHTPVIIPNNGMGNLNSIEVIYAPPPPPQPMSHIHIQDPLQKQNSPFLRESISMALKQNEYASRLRDIVQQRIQVAKQQEELRRNETCSSLFPQEQCLSQRPSNTQISLWQRLMGQNGSTAENNANLEGSDQQPYSCNINHKEQSGTIQALQEGQLFSAPEPSSLFQRWAPRVDTTYSQLFQAEGCAHKNAVINHLTCSVSNQFKNLDFSSDQTKLSDSASNPINGASASGDTTARRLS